MIDPERKGLSISAQCKLLKKSRSWYYYSEQFDPLKAQHVEREKRMIRKLWEKYRFFGYRQVYLHLDRSGYDTSLKR
jgi:hypothetical protein